MVDYDRAGTVMVTVGLWQKMIITMYTMVGEAV